MIPQPDTTTEVDDTDEGHVSDATPEGDISDATLEGDISDATLPDSESDPSEPAEDAETFPRSYVERLRRESQNYRDRAAKGDAYAQRLHTEMVRATGKLADPTDLPFSADHLDDPDALAAAVDDLLTRKPHLASRKPVGDIGQGPVSGSSPSVDLAAILRQRAQ